VVGEQELLDKTTVVDQPVRLEQVVVVAVSV
jgi:hypothetical protein